MLLQQIVKNKMLEVEKARNRTPLRAIKMRVEKMEPPRSLRNNLVNSGEVAVIAEIKRASPVKGLLRHDFNPPILAEAYEKCGAGAISVITESRYFKGCPEDLAAARSVVRLPVLRKDFIISEYQLLESRAIGADAVLLIVSILAQEVLVQLLELAASLGMDALVEAHNREEMARAVDAGASIIGINNRNLENFQVNLSTTLELASGAPDNLILVSESGIRSRDDILMLGAAGVKAVLIGETLMRAANPGHKLKELLGRPAGEDG